MIRIKKEKYFLMIDIEEAMILDIMKEMKEMIEIIIIMKEEKNLIKVIIDKEMIEVIKKKEIDILIIIIMKINFKKNS